MFFLHGYITRKLLSLGGALYSSGLIEWLAKHYGDPTKAIDISTDLLGPKLALPKFIISIEVAGFERVLRPAWPYRVPCGLGLICMIHIASASQDRPSIELGPTA